MIIKTNKLNLWYGAFQALIDVDLAIERNRITALIGPSGCGKSTLLPVFNRMNDLIEGVRMSGSVNFEGKEILDHEIDLITLRKRIGMVFQRPNPFPLSVFENVVYGLRVHGEKNKQGLAEAARISDDCGYLLLGELVEFADTKKIFTTPADKRTEDYITGRFG